MAVMIDLYCPKCEAEMIDVLVNPNEPITQKCDCGETMKKRVAKRMSFELKYDPKKDKCDWLGNTSRYWDAIKAAKARGEKVKPANEA